ncbi:MAG TPA: hypothetical protein PLY30_04390, partial [Candidatus Omnitrophota bacterium]|nr:hypothetical protein [Candidatus Omnitrophota bacterium]
GTREIDLEAFMLHGFAELFADRLFVIHDQQSDDNPPRSGQEMPLTAYPVVKHHPTEIISRNPAA